MRSQMVDATKPGTFRVALKLLPPDDPQVLHIVVVDAKGNPVPGAHVTVEDQPAKTDATGRASLDYDSALTGRKNLRVRVNRENGWARGMTSVDLPRKVPLTIKLDE